MSNPRQPDAELHGKDSPDEQAARWWLRFREGELLQPGAPSAQEFTQWRDADPAHRIAWDRMRSTSDALDDLPPADLKVLRSLARVSIAAPAGRGPRRRAWLQQTVLAGFAVATIGAGGWWLIDRQAQRPVFAQAYGTRRGEVLKVPLPDGSTLHLDTATRLRVVFHRDRREVHLEAGQALFEVAPDALKPFHVSAGATRVTVVGTRFQVRHIDPAVDVAVEQGKVHVWRLEDEIGVLLIPGQSVRADATGRLSHVESIPLVAIAPWRSGRLSFDDTPLAEVLAEFARYGETHVTLVDTRVAALRVTGSFEIARVQDLVRNLPQILPVRLQHRGELTELVMR